MLWTERYRAGDRDFEAPQSSSLIIKENSETNCYIFGANYGISSILCFFCIIFLDNCIIFFCLLCSGPKASKVSLPTLKDRLVNFWEANQSWTHGLEVSPGSSQRSQQVLHCLWTYLAISGLRLPGAGLCCGCRACLERWPGTLWVQHPPARLQEHLLWLLLSRLPHPPLGSPAYLRHLPFLHGRAARGLQGRPWTQVPSQARRGHAAVRQPRPKAWRPMVDLPHEPLH